MYNKKYLIIWPDSSLTTKSNHVNAPYHFIYLGEYVNYLNKQLGVKVDTLDIEASQIEFPDMMKKLINNNYDAIAFYLNPENLSNGLKILDYVKILNNECKTIAYGEMPLILPKMFLHTKFDAIVDKNCDQEVALRDYFKYSSSKDKTILHDIKMIYNNQFICTPKVESLDSHLWGFSTIDEVPINNYINMEGKNQYVMTISRGCPYGCKYCNATLYYGKNERRRPINDIINFINKNDYDYYKFFSPNFTLDKEYALNLCNRIIENGKKINWSCTTRPDLLNDEELIKKMSLAGCNKIAVGIESVSPKDLKSVDKRYDQGNISYGIELLKKYNIDYKALIMFGVPNQTKESILYTIEYLKSYDLDIRPTAYTPFYELNHNMTAEQISKYDKRTYYEGIDGLTYGDFLRLIYDTKNYQKVLKKEVNNEY